MAKAYVFGYEVTNKGLETPKSIDVKVNESVQSLYKTDSVKLADGTETYSTGLKVTTPPAATPQEVEIPKVDFITAPVQSPYLPKISSAAPSVYEMSFVPQSINPLDAYFQIKKLQYENGLKVLDNKLSAGLSVTDTNFENDTQRALAWYAAGITPEAYEEAANLRAEMKPGQFTDAGYIQLTDLLNSNLDLSLPVDLRNSLDKIDAVNSIFEKDFSADLFTNLAATLGYTKEDLNNVTTSDTAITAFKGNKSTDTYKAMMDARSKEISDRKIQVEKTEAAYKEMKSALDEKYDNKGYWKEYNNVMTSNLSQPEKEQKVKELNTKYNRDEYGNLLKNIKEPLKEAKKDLRKEKWGYFWDSLRWTGIQAAGEEFRKQVEAGEREWFDGRDAFSFNAGSLRDGISFKKEENESAGDSWGNFFSQMGKNLGSYWHETGKELWDSVVDGFIPSWKKVAHKGKEESSKVVEHSYPDINYGQPGLNDFWNSTNFLIFKDKVKKEKEKNKKALEENEGEIDKKVEETSNENENKTNEENKKPSKWESVVNPSIIFDNLFRDQLLSQYQFNMFFINSKKNIDEVKDTELKQASLVSYRVKGMSIPEYNRPVQKQNFGNMQLSLMVNRTPTAEFKSTWEFTCDRELNIFENMLAQTGSGVKVFKKGEESKYFKGAVGTDKMTDYTTKCDSLWDLSTGPTSRLSDGYGGKLAVGQNESGSILVLKVITAKELLNDYSMRTEFQGGIIPKDGMPVASGVAKPDSKYDLDLPVFIFEGFKILTMDYNLDFVADGSENCLNIKSEVSWRRMYIRRDKTYELNEGASEGKYYKPFTTLQIADISTPIKNEILRGDFNRGFPTLY